MKSNERELGLSLSEGAELGERPLLGQTYKILHFAVSPCLLIYEINIHTGIQLTPPPSMDGRHIQLW